MALESPTTTIDWSFGSRYLRAIACTCAASTARTFGTYSPRNSAGTPTSQLPASVLATAACIWLFSR